MVRSQQQKTSSSLANPGRIMGPEAHSLLSATRNSTLGSKIKNDYSSPKILGYLRKLLKVFGIRTVFLIIPF
jgi:hypothetical protein